MNKKGLDFKKDIQINSLYKQIFINITEIYFFTGIQF